MGWGINFPMRLQRPIQPSVSAARMSLLNVLGSTDTVLLAPALMLVPVPHPVYGHHVARAGTCLSDRQASRMVTPDAPTSETSQEPFYRVV